MSDMGYLEAFRALRDDVRSVEPPPDDATPREHGMYVLARLLADMLTVRFCLFVAGAVFLAWLIEVSV